MDVILSLKALRDAYSQRYGGMAVRKEPSLQNLVVASRQSACPHSHMALANACEDVIDTLLRLPCDIGMVFWHHICLGSV